MRIACPACDVTYDVPDTRLSPGGLVRCARCGVEWVPVASPALELDPRDGNTEPEPDASWQPSAWDEQAPADHPPFGSSFTPQPDRRLRAAWAGTGVLLTALLGCGMLWHATIMSVWPASERLYGLLGLHPAQSPARTAAAGHDSH